MAELFKFRCYQCQKLIGAPPSRFGSVVKCPKCGVDLVVPSPEDEPTAEERPDPDPNAFRPGDLGLNLDLDLGPIARTGIVPRAHLSPLPPGPDPIAFLQQASDTDDFPSPDFAEKASTGPTEAEPDATSDPDLPEPEVEPLVARTRGRPSPGSAGRSRDVVLPRTAAVAWALFAILALGFAFTAGLFVGQRFVR